jgi:competence protein ComEC
VVVPYLRHQGISHVDTIVISHGDNDHIGGLASLLDNVAVARIITSVPEAIPYRQVEPCADGQGWHWNEVEFAILHPPADRTGRDNDQSCVLRISIGDRAVLLTGDIERAAEDQLVQAHAEELRAQILVAPHHGSETSSSPAFIAVVNPDYVLFPVGYRNRFEFPSTEVRARYAERGVVALNVAEEGAIQFRMGNSTLLPESYRYEAARYWHTR